MSNKRAISPVFRKWVLYTAPDKDKLPIVDEVEGSPYTNPEIPPSGGGGLVSSMRDYYRFMSLLANGGELDNVRLLNKETVSNMTSNHLSGSTYPVRWNDVNFQNGRGYGFGIGVHIDKPRVGWFGSSGTAAWMYPGETILIAMPQAFRNDQVTDKFIEMARNAIIR